ncbi:hypothetical protein [Aureimonas sp. AU12]|uniref:hypothetical protein n=1 Tax=Aureimonas sp. AU12 TaxID=1638161 RepID=UPI0007865DB3|nr:hypothetical protein [Aureimonas sp. AU12]
MSARSYQLPGVRLVTQADAEPIGDGAAKPMARQSTDQTGDDYLEQAIIGALVLVGSVFVFAFLREIV